MKTKIFIGLLATILLFPASSNFSSAQSDADRPAYITVTKMHWNMKMENFDMDEWKNVEKEYLEKVTKKNEYIMGSSFHMHMYTPDNSELMYVQVFKSWGDIEKAQDRNDELAMEAWPNEKDREAFFKKQQGYYSMKHSDEIYAPIGIPKLAPQSEKDRVTYLRVGKFAFPEDGTQEEFDALNNEFIQNVYLKNDLLKGYYPNAHAWGSDRRDYLEAFIVDSLADLEGLQAANWEKIQAHWPDEKARQEFMDKYGKYFLPYHEDYLYRSISGLGK